MKKLLILVVMLVSSAHGAERKPMVTRLNSEELIAYNAEVEKIKKEYSDEAKVWPTEKYSDPGLLPVGYKPGAVETLEFNICPGGWMKSDYYLTMFKQTSRTESDGDLHAKNVEICKDNGLIRIRQK